MGQAPHRERAEVEAEERGEDRGQEEGGEGAVLGRRESAYVPDAGDPSPIGRASPAPGSNARIVALP